MSFAAAVSAWQSRLRRKRASASTVRNYERDIDQLRKFLSLKHARALEDLRLVDGAVLLGFASYRQERDADTTVQRRLSAARSFLRSALRDHLIDRVPVVSKLRPNKFTAVAVPEKLAAAVAEYPMLDKYPERNRACVELTLEGLGPGEICGLSLDDVDPEGTWVLRDGEPVTLSNRCARALRKWLNVGRPRLENHLSAGALFLGARGRALHPAEFRRFVRRSGPEGSGLNPRTLRYSAAASRLAENPSWRTVKEFLGHRDRSTTTRYLKSLRAIQKRRAEGKDDAAPFTEKDVAVAFLRDGVAGVDALVETGEIGQELVTTAAMILSDAGKEAPELAMYVEGRFKKHKGRRPPIVGGERPYRAIASKTGPFARIPLYTLGIVPGDDVAVSFVGDQAIITRVRH